MKPFFWFSLAFHPNSTTSFPNPATFPFSLTSFIYISLSLYLSLSLVTIPPFPNHRKRPLLQMSQLLTSSPKHCAKHGMNIDKRYKKLLYSLSTFLLFILSIGVLIWLILRPTKPQFYLKQADIYQLNLSGPHLLNSSIQITIVSKNPNRRVGVFYDQLQAYAAYKGQQITLHASLPPFYQGHEDSNLLTASLLGDSLPVAPSFGYEVGRDQLSGKLLLGLKLNGRLRWKVGTWVSGRYPFNVDCVTVMSLGPNPVSAPMSSKQGAQCSTSV